MPNTIETLFQEYFFVEERVLIIHYSGSGEKVEKVENLLTNDRWRAEHQIKWDQNISLSCQHLIHVLATSLQHCKSYLRKAFQ